MFHLYNTLPPFTWLKTKKKRRELVKQSLCLRPLYSLLPLCLITLDFRFTWNLVLMASHLVLCPTYSTTTTTFMAKILAGYSSCFLTTSSVPSVCLRPLSHILLLPALLINSCYVCSCLIWHSSDRTVPTTNTCDCVVLVIGRDSLPLRKTVLNVLVKWTFLNNFLG